MERDSALERKEVLTPTLTQTNLEAMMFSETSHKRPGFLYDSTYGRYLVKIIVVVQSLSHVGFFATPWTAACQASLPFTISQSLLKLMSIESVMLSNRLIFSPLLLLPSVFPSISVFSNESVLHIRGPKYWSFSFSPSNEYSRLISFRTD